MPPDQQKLYLVDAFRSQNLRYLVVVDHNHWDKLITTGQCWTTSFALT